MKVKKKQKATWKKKRKERFIFFKSLSTGSNDWPSIYKKYFLEELLKIIFYSIKGIKASLLDIELMKLLASRLIYLSAR